MTNLYQPRGTCPYCKRLLVAPGGDPKSAYLLAGEYPGYKEIESGRPFVGDAGDVLRAELDRVDLNFDDFRVTNLWLHASVKVTEPKKGKEPDPQACNPDWHLEQLVKEFKGKTHVLLMGSDVLAALNGNSVMAYSGLRIKLPEFPTVHFWVAPNPAAMLRGQTVGEFRLAMQRFADDIHKKK